MPRYRYMCHTCMHEFITIHSYNDEQDSCTSCESQNITKLLSRPLEALSKPESVTGQTTKEYIDSNKEILDDLKKQSISENYEPS